MRLRAEQRTASRSMATRIVVLLAATIAGCGAADMPLADAPATAPTVTSPAGLVQLPCDEASMLRPASPRYCAGDGKHWVTPTARAVLEAVTARFTRAHPGSAITYMEASWPSGIRPMPPHLSHGDGRQVDIALFHLDRAGKPLARPPTQSGYGAFEPPRPGEPRPCAAVTRPANNEDPPANRGWQLDEARNRTLIQALLDDPRVARILIEPHLEQRLGFAGHPKMRFPGCHAMRHDSHIHVEVVRDDSEGMADNTR